jgi:hypothetical protein
MLAYPVFLKGAVGSGLISGVAWGQSSGQSLLNG